MVLQFARLYFAEINSRDFQQEGELMKRVAIFMLLAGLLSTTGCAYRLDNDWGSTPGYSSRERNFMIDRNIDYEGKQIIDDFDSILLLRPASRMTIWHVR